MTTRSQKRRWIVACLLLLAFLFWWLWPRPPVTGRAPVSPIDGRPTNEELHTEGYWPLPFYDVDPGEPLPGRPDVQMPIPRRIYERVELTIDGEPIQEPIALPAGKLVRFAGTIHARPDYPLPITMDGHIGWVTKAANERGWLIRWFFMPSESGGRDQTCEFRGEFHVPDVPGEYLLVVLSSASSGVVPEIPILMAAAYDAEIIPSAE